MSPTLILWLVLVFPAYRVFVFKFPGLIYAVAYLVLLLLLVQNCPLCINPSQVDVLDLARQHCMHLFQEVEAAVLVAAASEWTQQDATMKAHDDVDDAGGG